MAGLLKFQPPHRTVISHPVRSEMPRGTGWSKAATSRHGGNGVTRTVTPVGQGTLKDIFYS